MKLIKYILAIVLFLSLIGCTKKDEYIYSNKTNLMCGFNTLCQLNAYTKNEEEFNKYYEIMSNEFSHYHKLFDIYNNYDGINNIKTINDNAGIKEVEVDPVIIELIEQAQEITILTDGAFDITNGAVLKIWHNYREEGKQLNSEDKYGNIPSKEELDKASVYKGYEYIEIDKTNNTVFITDENVSLDVGGIAKGFATEKVAKSLENAGLKYGAVNAGGNQRIIGSKPDNSGFNVGITDPRGNGSIARIDNQINTSIVTSGDYQNYYYANDEKRYSHIIDPKTNFPATYYYGVSIVTNDSGLADCLSTAFFTLNYEEGLKLIDKINQQYHTDIIVVWISEEPLDDTSIKSKLSIVDEYITCSENFKDKLVTE